METRFPYLEHIYPGKKIRYWSLESFTSQEKDAKALT